MFRNVQIRWKLSAILVVPLAALVVFASLQVGTAVSRRTTADRLSRLTGLAVRITSLADALQQERATSSGFVASGKTRYSADMVADRDRVDTALDALRTDVDKLDVESYTPRLQADLADAVQRSGDLPGWRTTLTGTTVPVTRVVNFYGDLLDSLLSVITDIGGEQAGESVKAGVNSLVEIVRAKEAASQSTSLLLTVLLTGQFGPGEYQRFATLVGAEDSSEVQFLNVASRDQQTFYQHTVAGADNSSKAEVMRQAALAGPDAPSGLQPDPWLTVMSTKIDQLHKVELRAAADMAAASIRARNAAVRQTVVTTTAMIVVILLALGLSLLLARSMAHPLEVLEQSARDVAEHHLPELVERLQQPDAQIDQITSATLAGANRVPIRSRDEIGRVAEAFNAVRQVAIRVAAEQAALRKSIGDMFLNLARRSQGLVDRQLELMDELEREEVEPAALESLFRLDHLATRMRRNAENLIVLSGAETPRRWSDPIPLPQVVRGAIAEVEDYPRVELLAIDDLGVVGHVAADVIHLLAELIENATSFSPPGTPVRISGQPASNSYVLEIQDCGLGMTDEELDKANQRLANPPAIDVALSRRLGLFVVGRLAQRYGIRVKLEHSWNGGVVALALLPATVIVALQPQGAVAWEAPARRLTAAPHPPPSSPLAGASGHAPASQPAGSDWFDIGTGSDDLLPIEQIRVHPPLRPDSAGLAGATSYLGAASTLPSSQAGPGQPRSTRAGLPRRAAGASLNPALADDPRTTSSRHPTAAPSPEQARAVLSSYRSGVERGRHLAGSGIRDEPWPGHAGSDDDSGAGDVPVDPTEGP